MLKEANNYTDLYENFSWEIPEYYNIGFDVCDKWAEKDPNRTAIISAFGSEQKHTSFEELKKLSNKIANSLVLSDVKVGDRVGILLPQSVETAASHIAVYKMGAIAVPLFVLFGPSALEHRIIDAGIKLIITNHEGAKKLNQMSSKAYEQLTVLINEELTEEEKQALNFHTLDFNSLLEGASEEFTSLKTKADDPALIIYTSGTTGPSKGALHAHRVLLGHLPGMEMSHDFFPKSEDVIWTPADWAWIGGLLDVLLPALHHGVPVVAGRFKKFTGEAAFELMSKCNVTNVFMPSTALKMLRNTHYDANTFPLKLRTIASGGETLGVDLLSWGKETLGVNINEFYGQTECNLIISSCASLMEARPGIMGRPVPGHVVKVLRQDGSDCSLREQGLIAVKRNDPVMLLHYWNNEDATQNKFLHNYLLTGDVGQYEEDGWIRFVGRDDDVITSAGYRIGPGEIEETIIKHPSVYMVAVVGKPDKLRTEIVKAYIVLHEKEKASEQLVEEIQAFVKDHLASYEYPREIEFLSQLPLTNTGKIIRRTLREQAREEYERAENE